MAFWFLAGFISFPGEKEKKSSLPRRLFLAPSYLIISRRSWQASRASDGLLVSWFVRGEPSPALRQGDACLKWSMSASHLSSRSKWWHGDFLPFWAKFVNEYFYVNNKNNSQSWIMTPVWWLCCFTFPVIFSQCKEMLQTSQLTLNSRLSNDTVISFTTTCRAQYFPVRCYFPSEDTVWHNCHKTARMQRTDFSLLLSLWKATLRKWKKEKLYFK